MINQRRYMTALFIGTLVATGSAILSSSPFAADPLTVSDRALSAARRETKMLDTLYKTAIVAVTNVYVNDESSTAAGTAFQSVFKAMKEGKHHEVRLVDGLGQPIESGNKPRDDFERTAMKRIMAGDANVDQVEWIDSMPHLRTMTTLPMVMEKCVMCHENFRNQKIVGGLSYVVPIMDPTK